MEHVRNEELLSFHKLTDEEQEILRREVKNGNVEWCGHIRRECTSTHGHGASVFIGNLPNNLTRGAGKYAT